MEIILHALELRLEYLIKILLTGNIISYLSKKIFRYIQLILASSPEVRTHLSFHSGAILNPVKVLYGKDDMYSDVLS